MITIKGHMENGGWGGNDQGHAQSNPSSVINQKPSQFQHLIMLFSLVVSTT